VVDDHGFNNFQIPESVKSVGESYEAFYARILRKRLDRLRRLYAGGELNAVGRQILRVAMIATAKDLEALGVKDG
jgi:hypothetical protein